MGQSRDFIEMTLLLRETASCIDTRYLASSIDIPINYRINCAFRLSCRRGEWGLGSGVAGPRSSHAGMQIASWRFTLRRTSGNLLILSGLELLVQRETQPGNMIIWLG